VIIADVAAAPVLGLMAFGVVMAIVGHAVRDRRIVGFGIAALFVATALMVLGAFSAYQGDESDPRPNEDFNKPF
jgi:type IV secretory pathway TrbD component